MKTKEKQMLWRLIAALLITPRVIAGNFRVTQSLRRLDSETSKDQTTRLKRQIAIFYALVCCSTLQTFQIDATSMSTKILFAQSTSFILLTSMFFYVYWFIKFNTKPKMLTALILLTEGTTHRLQTLKSRHSAARTTGAC